MLRPERVIVSTVLRFSRLTPARRALVRLCQRMNFGLIRNLWVKNSEPLFDPPPIVLIDERLDVNEVPRPEVELSDFSLPVELCRLISRLDELNNGVIDRIEVRGGLPRRVTFESKLVETLGLKL
jgi:hypothetical protein